jgi:DNA-binding MarR family transcriptional regulator
MATQRVSRRQKHILRLLIAEYHRSHGRMSMGHLELVKALAGDKSNISHSLRTLETRGWIVISRTPSGRAESLDLTPAGLEKASEI